MNKFVALGICFLGLAAVFALGWVVFSGSYVMVLNGESVDWSRFFPPFERPVRQNLVVSGLALSVFLLMDAAAIFIRSNAHHGNSPTPFEQPMVFAGLRLRRYFFVFIAFAYPILAIKLFETSGFSIVPSRWISNENLTWRLKLVAVAILFTSRRPLEFTYNDFFNFIGETIRSSAKWFSSGASR